MALSLGLSQADLQVVGQRHPSRCILNVRRRTLTAGDLWNTHLRHRCCRRSFGAGGYPIASMGVSHRADREGAEGIP